MTQAPMRRRTWLAAAAAAGAMPAALFAQGSYPSRPIELIVPAGAGGGTDVVARGFAEAARTHLAQPVLVINRPGASGMIGHGEMINAKPDGYKLAIVFAEICIVPHLGQSKLSYEDFVPIARLNADPAAITVRADAPWNTIEEFLSASRAKPGELRMGNSGTGSGFESVPTLKERGIDLSIGTWRGLGAPRGTPADVLAILADVTRKSAQEPVFRDALDRLGMGNAYADADTFRAEMKRDNERFKQLVTSLGIKG
jgi:tripartite-type tricarboxylate transporter receptor subunit TctC